MVPIVAMMFTSFWAFTVFLNTFSIPLKSIHPMIPPRVLLIISVMSKAPILKTNYRTSQNKLTKKNEKIFVPVLSLLNKIPAYRPNGIKINTFKIISP